MDSPLLLELDIPSDEDLYTPVVAPIVKQTQRRNRGRKAVRQMMLTTDDDLALTEPVAISAFCKHCAWKSGYVRYSLADYRRWTEARDAHQDWTGHECYVIQDMPATGPHVYCWHGNVETDCLICHPDLPQPTCRHGNDPWSCATCKERRRKIRLAMSLTTVCIHGVEIEEYCPVCNARGYCAVCQQRTSTLYVHPKGWEEYRCDTHALERKVAEPCEKP